MPAPTNTQFAVAVHVLSLLGNAAPELRSSEALAGSAGTTPEHVRRVLAPLRRAGLIRSRPGPHGGWQLDQASCATNLAEIWRALHGEDAILGVHAAAPDCSAGQQIQSVLEDLDRRAVAALLGELERQTLGDIIARAAAV